MGQAERTGQKDSTYVILAMTAVVLRLGRPE
jgi:hypothetical protein